MEYKVDIFHYLFFYIKPLNYQIVKLLQKLLIVGHQIVTRVFGHRSIELLL